MQPITPLLMPVSKNKDFPPRGSSNLCKHPRPISLTPACISKLAEDFVVSTRVSTAVLKVFDFDQYSGIPKSSTMYVLISMIHCWSQATDATSAVVRVLR